LEWDGTEEAAQFQQVLSAIKGLIGGAIPIRQFAKPMPVTYAKTPELVPTLNTLEANYWVTELALSPNEKLLAWVCYNGPGQVVRLADGMSLHEFTGSSVAFSADGTMLAVGGAFGIQLLEPETGKELQKRFGGVSDCVNVKFSSDGKWLAAARGMHHRVDLWRVPNSEPEYQLPHEGYVVCVAFSPGGTALASASRDNLARIWRVRDGKLLHTLEGHTDKDVNCVDFSPDGTVVASGGTDETVRLWRSSEGSLLRVLKTTGRVGSVTFSPDGVILATTSIPNSNDVQLWSVADGVLLHTIEAHNDIVSHVMFSPDGQMLLSGSRDGTVKLWSLAGLD
jgi:WD40 repeat protein